MNKDITHDKQVNTEIEAFVDLLKNTGVPVSKVVLFGSYARGYADEASDIDLAVLSDSFANDGVDATMMLSKLSWRVSDRIESIALTPHDMTLIYHPLIGEIHKYGKVVFSQ